MFELFLGVDTSVGAAMLIFWALASWQLGRLPRRTDPRKLAIGTRWALGLLAFATLPALIKVALIGAFAAQGWEFGADRVLIVGPLVVVPVVLTYVWTVPALRRLGRAARTARTSTVDSESTVDSVDSERTERTGLATGLATGRAALAELKPALPPRLAAIAGAFALWMGFILQPVPPYWNEALVYGFLFLVAALVQVAKLRGIPAKVLAGAAFPGLRTRVLRSGARVVAFVAVLALAMIWSSSTSKLPDSYNMADHGGARAAGGHQHGGIAPVANGSGKSITELTGPKTGDPDVRFTLTAQTTQITLPSGAKTDGWTFNGTIPGPLLRVKQGQLVEVELVNKDVPAGVSLHWHGVDVPNAEDGVPGLTQDAVGVGQRHVYRFRAPDTGSFWYHSHQVSSEQVRRGLYGAFIVDPATVDSATEIPVVLHTFKGQLQVMNGSDQLTRKQIAPGTTVRLRLFNSDSLTRKFAVTGTPFRVVAIDGTAVNKPTDLTGTLLYIGGGARYDVEFTMPNGPVRLATTGFPKAGMLFSPDGNGDLAADLSGDEFDPTTYGTAVPTPFDANSRFNQEITWYIDNHFGFYNGKFAMIFTVNGDVFPDIPPVMVREGDLVKMRFVNRSYLDHPMHLHGHHVLVLSRNGKAATGSPQWLDTVTVHPGDTYEIAFKADNPGLWMDHCHDLDHAALGMVMHLMYEGYTTPYLAGKATPNQPE